MKGDSGERIPIVKVSFGGSGIVDSAEKPIRKAGYWAYYWGMIELATEEREYSEGLSSLFPKALQAVRTSQRLRIRDYDERKGIINAQAGASALSWGENVVIELVPSGLGTKVRVTSKTRLLTNILHGGVVDENITQFFDALDNEA